MYLLRLVSMTHAFDPMRLDLHIHSTASDGALPPQEVLVLCEAARLDVIALADHDTTAGVRRLNRLGIQGPIQVVPALEVSSTLDRRELHFLGYFVDPYSDVIYRHEERAVRLRDKTNAGHDPAPGGPGNRCDHRGGGGGGRARTGLP